MQKSAVQLKIEAQLQASVDLLKQAKRYVGQSTTIGGQDLSREITEFVAAVDRNPADTPPACGQCRASTTDTCNDNGCGYLESGNGAPEACDHYMKVLAEDGTKCFCYHCGVDLTAES